MAQRLNGQMDVGVFVVEVLDEDVVVIVPEGFDRKRPRRILDRNRVSSRRHSESVVCDTKELEVVIWREVIVLEPIRVRPVSPCTRFPHARIKITWNFSGESTPK